MTNSDAPQPQKADGPDTSAEAAIAAAPVAAGNVVSTGINPYAPGILPAQQVILVPVAQQQLAQQIQTWQGPFPHPTDMRAYEDILPGTFERMLKMAEEAQRAQIDTVRRAQEFTRGDIARGHYLGFIGMLAAMGGALWCASHGQRVIAGLFLGLPVMTVIKILVDSIRAAKAPTGETPKETPKQPQGPSPSA